MGKQCECNYKKPKPKKCCEKKFTKEYVCTKTVCLKCCEKPKKKYDNDCNEKWENISKCEKQSSKKQPSSPKKCCECCEIHNFFKECTFECKKPKPMKKEEYKEEEYKEDFDDYDFDEYDDDDCDC